MGIGADRRNVDPAVLVSISGDLALGIAHVMTLVSALAIAAALVAWLFRHVVAKDA